MRQEHVSYEELTPWPPWVAMLIATACLVPAAMLGREALDPSGGAVRAAVVLLVVATPIVFWLILGRMTVRVTRTTLLLGFGFVPLVRKAVHFDEIVRLDPVTYAPLKEFGGWGIRWGKGGRRAWTIRGSRALSLELRDGSALYVGSENPERLAERIRAAAGRRFTREELSSGG